MKIIVKTMSGKIITLDVEEDYTIKQVKQQIQENELINPLQQCLVYGVYRLEDDKTIRYYNINNINNNNIIYLVIRLLGG